MFNPKTVNVPYFPSTKQVIMYSGGLEPNRWSFGGANPTGDRCWTEPESAPDGSGVPVRFGGQCRCGCREDAGSKHGRHGWRQCRNPAVGNDVFFSAAECRPQAVGRSVDPGRLTSQRSLFMFCPAIWKKALHGNGIFTYLGVVEKG